MKGAPDYEGVASRVMRPDIYMEAMKEIGVTPKVAADAVRSWTAARSTRPNPEKYARSFPINSVAG